MSEVGDGVRVRKRSSFGVPGGSCVAGRAPNMFHAGTGEDTKRTTRAASKRAAADDSVRPIFSAQCAQQVKKRAALASLPNNSNIPALRRSFPDSKGSSAGPNIALKSKPPGGLTQSRNADVAAGTAVKRDKLVGDHHHKCEDEMLAHIENRDLLEKVPPSRLEIDAATKGGNSTLLLSLDIKDPASESDAASMTSLERKTLEKLYISRSTNVGLRHESGWSNSQTFTDIDCELSDPQMCSVYALDIYQHLRMQEVKRRPTTEFMEMLQHDINASMRGILIDWLVEVAEEYKLVPDTLYLTVSYIDRFLSSNVVNRQRLQLLGVSCMLIAAKYEEICAPQVEEFCYITDNTYAREEVLEMERRVLTNLHFELTTPTTKSFLRRFIRAAQAAQTVPALQLEFLGNYLAELTLVEYTFLHYLPSLVAASAVFVARLTLDRKTCPWNLTLQHYTGYRAADLQECVREIHELQCNTRNCSLPAIREKYSQHKFKCVATLIPPAKIPDEYFANSEG